jgi:hypothetical protein
MSRLLTLLFGAALGAAAVYFLRRRADHDESAVAQAWPSTPTPTPTPAPAPADVQTEIFRDAEAPKEGTWSDRVADDAKEVDGLTEAPAPAAETPAPAAETEPRETVTERRY